MGHDFKGTITTKLSREGNRQQVTRIAKQRFAVPLTDRAIDHAFGFADGEIRLGGRNWPWPEIESDMGTLASELGRVGARPQGEILVCGGSRRDPWGMSFRKMTITPDGRAECEDGRITYGGD